MSMKSNSAFQRLQAEYRRLAKDPIPYLTAQPLSSNLLEWRYVVRGPTETPYEGGIYQGKIVFPFEYPYKPPSKSQFIFLNYFFSFKNLIIRYIYVNTEWKI
jgi:ubiquitin-conjugating enzyme E2 J2